MLTVTLPRALLAAVLLSFAPRIAMAQMPVPTLKARVTDLTGTLTRDQIAGLEAKLASFESRKGSQVSVLMVPTTQPETIEQYAIRAFDAWKLGRKGVDDGVLLLIAKNDRKLRIEVGRGLEGAIPDAYAKRIIEEEIVPRFKQGDFVGGVTAGVERIAKLIEGEPMPPPRSTTSRSGSAFPPLPHSTTSGSEHAFDALFIGFIVIFGALILANILHALLGQGIASGAAGVGSAIVMYLVAGSLVAALIVGILVFFGSLFAKTSPGYGGSWSSGGGWSSSSGSSGGSWSSSDSGGFSGGGGESAGGGASGSW